RDATLLRRGAAGRTEHLAQADHGQEFVAYPQRVALAGDPGDVAMLDAARFDHRGQRQDVGLGTHGHRHGLHDRERQWHADGDRGAGAFARMQSHFPAAQHLDVPAHHVHADAAAGDVGDRFGGGKTRLENELPYLLVVRVRIDADAALGGALEDAFAVQSLAVVAHLDHDAAALLAGAQPDGSGTRLAGGQPLGRRLDPVVDRIAHQVRQRVGDLLYQAAVELRGLAGNLELDFLAEALRKFAHQARETREYRGYRHHPDRHHCFLQVARVPPEVDEPRRVARIALLEPLLLREHRLRDHKLADQVDQQVHL